MSKVKAGLAPAGSAVSTSLDDGVVTLIIKGIQPLENGCYVTLEYPGGFIKDHQVVEPLDLLPKIVNQLRGRYGVDAVKVLTNPILETNFLIDVEVTNGAKS